MNSKKILVQIWIGIFSFGYLDEKEIDSRFANCCFDAAGKSMVGDRCSCSHCNSRIRGSAESARG